MKLLIILCFLSVARCSTDISYVQTCDCDEKIKEMEDEIFELKKALIPTDLLGWTVFQRRMDGSVDFYRVYKDYTNGFGDGNGEFWLGLRTISNLMKEGSYELRIDMQDFDGNWRYAYYKNFYVGPERDNFPVTASGYVGNAGNGFTGKNGPFKGVKFSAKDRDNDNHSTDHCAQKYKGGWWYDDCHVSNLNGLYLHGSHESYADGIEWEPFRGYHYSLKFTEMKMRLRGQ